MCVYCDRSQKTSQRVNSNSIIIIIITIIIITIIIIIKTLLKCPGYSAYYKT